MPGSTEISNLTVNRLSLYLACLRRLQGEGLARISSKDLARRFQLSATQIRKDLAQFGEFGIRGVGYDIERLIDQLTQVLGLERQRRLIVVGMGNLGSALARYFGFNHGPFRVVAGVDNDARVIGKRIAGFVVQDSRHLKKVVAESGAEIGVLAVPPEAAQANFNALAAVGIRGVLNFSPPRLQPRPDIPVKDVDLRTDLEELVFYLKE